MVETRKVSVHLRQLFAHAHAILQARPELEEADRTLTGADLVQRMKAIGAKFNLAGVL